MKRIATTVLVAGAVLLAVAVLAVAFDPQWCIGVTKRAVYGPPPEPVHVSLTVTADGAVSIDGEEWRGPVATKTQVTDAAQTISGVLSVINQGDPGVSAAAPTKAWSIHAGGVVCKLLDISESGWDGADPQPAPPDGTKYTFAAWLYSEGPMPISHHEFYYMPDGGACDLSVAYSIKISGFRLYRARTSSPSEQRDSSPVYARETVITDSLVLDPVNWDLSFGNLADSGDDAGDTGITGIEWMRYDIEQAGGTGGQTYASMTCAWSECVLNFSGMGRTVDNMRFVGDGGGLSMVVNASFAMPPAQWQTHEIQLVRPYLPDFSEFAVVDRVGTLIDTLRIDGGFKVDKRHAWTLPYGDPGDTIYPTVAEIRAIGQYATPPGVDGLDYEDADYEHQLWTPPLSFAINAESARAHKLI